MFKKMLPMLLMILVAITLIIAAAFALWVYLDKQDAEQLDANAQAKGSVAAVAGKKLKAADVREWTVEINDMLTNLSGKDFIKISFAFELENAKVANEFELLDFKVKAIIIQTLSDLTSEEIQGSKGYDYLNSILMNKINPILSEGKLKQIYITNFILS